MQTSSAHRNEPLSCKENGNSLLSTSYFHIVNYINIWTNVNSYNHNTGHSNDITKADKVLTILFMVCIKPLRLVACNAAVSAVLQI